ncbi:ribonuclease III [Ruminiclostridium herbifermentans]|uniref:Ribonuclease 3 n=2 Tax=Ruminiclostridium herbifermentans TaxID=2488810 RepID=A0A4V6EQ18_9FIRM|nr:ribonuclease III [Ruminiclostridium herbifermentans]QNU68838.1 ribonuclease III [Ruminiclostridium herbifermentans]
MKMNNNDLINSLSELEGIIKYDFKDKKILQTAITHSSYANERKSKKLNYNERIEFLGDSVLSLVISEYLYKMYPNLPEGELTVTRAKIVCENSLAKCAADIGLGTFLLLGKGEELSGGRVKSSILSDAFEALIGAIYNDGGFETAKAFILKYMEDVIKSCVNGKLFYDYKTQLQELVQQNGEQNIAYNVIDESGPDHNKTFVTEVCINGLITGKGTGHSKKESEQNAAKDALTKINNGDKGVLYN